MSGAGLETAWLELEFQARFAGETGFQNSAAVVRLELLKPKHWTDDSFDCPVVLLANGIEALQLSQFEIEAGVGIDAANGYGVGSYPCTPTLSYNGAKRGRNGAFLPRLFRMDQRAITVKL